MPTIAGRTLALFILQLHQTLTVLLLEFGLIPPIIPGESADASIIAGSPRATAV
jgi:hypothetical protein